MTARPDTFRAPAVTVADAPGALPPATVTAPTPASAAEHGREGRLKVYIWQIPVRATHWVTAGAIVTLSVTGLYIADPFLIPAGGAVMTTIRLIHMLSAFVLLASGLLRTFWLLRGNRWSHWKAFIPLTWFQFTELFRQAGFYAFIRKEIPKVLGHNQLAASAYLVLFALLLVEVVTGFALDGLIGSEPGASLFGWLVDLVGPQTLRLLHHFAMWAILAIALFHIYSCVLVDHIEKNGLMSSIFSGFKFPTRTEILESRDGGPEVLEQALEAQKDDEH
jgi:Ni/Fe-hydrogenase 1 B-type cytochrome subunit